MTRGQVTEFDAVRGIGTVAGPGGAAHWFHAANIADGSRRIEVGADVVFQPLPRFGEWEAAQIQPI